MRIVLLLLLSSCVPKQVTVVHKWKPLVCKWEPLTLTLCCAQAGSGEACE